MKKILKIAGALLLLAGLYFLTASVIRHNKRSAFQNTLSGKVVIITGASGGLGSELVKVASGLKMRVALTDINPDISLSLIEGIKKAGGEAIFIKADLIQQNDRIKIIEETVKAFGGIDMLINNAAYGYMALNEKVDLTAAKRNFDVNFWAAVDLAKLATPFLEKSAPGIIINISSMASLIPERWGSPTAFYAASKAALNNWTKVLSIELSPKNIHVKLVAPYGIRTGFFKSMTGEAKDMAMEFPNEGWSGYDDAGDVARDIFYLLGDNTLVILPGKAKYLIDISRFLYPEIY